MNGDNDNGWDSVVVIGVEEKEKRGVMSEEDDNKKARSEGVQHSGNQMHWEQTSPEAARNSNIRHISGRFAGAFHHRHSHGRGAPLSCRIVLSLD